MKKSLTTGACALLVTAGLALTPSATAHQPATAASTPGAAAAAAASFVSAHPTAFFKGAGESLVQKASIAGGNGFTYTAYERTLQGLPVVGGDFVVATNRAGQVTGTSVALTKGLDRVSTTPTVTAAAATATARAQLDKVSSVEGSDLVVYAVDRTALAWATTVNGTKDGETSRLTVYVDAHSGKVLGSKEHVAHGTGSGAWSGSVSLNTTLSGGTYKMIDPTMASLKCQDWSTGAVFSGSDDAWGNGVASDRETGCVDALYGAQQERSMLTAWLGRNGFDGNGGGWPIRMGWNNVNAQYNGIDVQIGHAQNNSNWISEIDVVAHELGHGIDDHTPGGLSGGGTQEFIADTFGAATEAYANNAVDKPDYTVGEMVNLVGTGPIRYMYNPSLAGDDNCWTKQTAHAEVHAAAGPGNHWYYLLAEGTNPTNGQPTSPTCNGSTLTGIGIQKTQTILYNAMLMKTSRSGYPQYRVWTVTAAKNLYGAADCQKVKNAWSAVGLGAQTGEPAC